MAVVQISRIQLRRGQKNQGSGLPQLASGEMGWAIDTRELFIGNGSVSEGAPTVGNTKILTQYDDIFALANSYAYRGDEAFFLTGESAVSPIKRTLQDRLDDRVSIRAFGATGDSSQPAKGLLQRAIDQLYLNAAIKGSEQSRVELHIEAGIYSIDGTIFVPPNATIIGAGSDKTIIRTTANAPIFQTVNDHPNTGPGVYEPDSSSTFNNQARNIKLKGMTLENTVADSKGIHIQTCRNSIFEDIIVKGPWTQVDSIPGDYDNDIGILITSLSGAVESKDNKFINCKVSGWAYGVMSNWDIDHHIFDMCEFSTLGNGFAFGVDMVLGSEAQGTSVGPTNTIISNSKFININRYGIWIENGTSNTSKSNSFSSVGNEAGAEHQPVYSVIYYKQPGNQSVNDHFTRTPELSYGVNSINSVPYIPEITGVVDYTSGYHLNRSIGRSTAGYRLFRLPGFGHHVYNLHYQMVSNTYEMQRSGILKIVVEPRATPSVTISDDYDFTGDATYEDSISFSAEILDLNSDLTNDTVGVKVISNMPSNDSTSFRYNVVIAKSDIG
tara:strand:+ start:1860 stop:3524 length:1665 start_codon:yes stop_codon:yes gene_type:complete